MKYQFRFGKTIVPDGGPLSEQEKKPEGTRALFCAIKNGARNPGIHVELLRLSPLGFLFIIF